MQEADLEVLVVLTERFPSEGDREAGLPGQVVQERVSSSGL